MQVFKAFFKILNRNKTSLLMYTIIYLAITVITMHAMQEEDVTGFSEISLDVGVENRDTGNMGRTLVEYLESRHQIQKVPKEKEDLQDAMYYEELDYVLIIPEDFTEKFEQGETEGVLEGTVVPGSSAAYLMEHKIESFLKIASMYRSGGFEVEEAAKRASEDMEEKGQVEFLEKNGGQRLPGGFYFFQYLPYVFVVMMILGLGVAMKEFQEKNLAARNKCSAMSFFKQNGQIFLGCMVYMMMVYLVFMVMACGSVGDYMMSLQGVLSAANALIFMFCSLSVAWFAAQFAYNAAILSIMSNVFGLAFSFLGGVFVSLELMGERGQQMAKFVPSYWYVMANREIQKMTSFSEAKELFPFFLMVLVFTLAFFSLGLLVNRMRVKSR